MECNGPYIFWTAEGVEMGKRGKPVDGLICYLGEYQCLVRSIQTRPWLFCLYFFCLSFHSFFSPRSLAVSSGK